MANRAAPGLPASRLRPGGRAFQQAGDPQGGIGPGAPAAADAPTGPPGGSLSPSLASLQMRGGLGKTLLLAFLSLAILPLSFLAFLTYHQVQQTTQQRLLASLETNAPPKDRAVEAERARARSARRFTRGADGG